MGDLSDRIAAIRERLARGRAREALAQIEEAREAMAGPLAVTLALFDVATVLSVLGREKARFHARLLRLEASARLALGEPISARARVTRACAIERALGD